MKYTADIEPFQNQLLISGALTFSTVMDIWNRSLSLMKQNKELHFDLSQVKTCNSAGVALLLEWVRYAKSQNKIIKLHHIPAQMMAIITVSGLQILLQPLTSS